MTTTPNKINKKLKKFDFIFQSKDKLKDPLSKYCHFAYQQLLLKYYSIPLTYQINIINNIIYNEKSKIVATFKDYLILDDSSEFLKRYYKLYESLIRLPRFFEYYNTFSKIFPNYTSILEGKYIYRNIQKKQRMIDIQEQMEMENKHNELMSPRIFEKDDIFNTEVIDSILNDTNKEDIEILFNVNRDNNKIEDQKFSQKVLDLVNTIGKFENFSYENGNENIFMNNCKNNSIKNLNSNIIKKYLNKTNLSNVSNVCPKKSTNPKYNIFNLYSKKRNDKFYINDSNHPKSERTLFEKLEYNLLKLSKKTKKNSKKNSNSTNKIRNKSRRDDSTSSKHNISSYSRNIKNSSSINFNNHKSSKSINNIFNSLNVPQTFRLGTNSIISSNENNIKSPVTKKLSNNKNKKKNINISNSNKNNINNSKYICENPIYHKVNSMNNIHIKTSRNQNENNYSNQINIQNHNLKYSSHTIFHNGDSLKRKKSNNKNIRKRNSSNQKNEKSKKRNGNISNSITGNNMTSRESNLKDFYIIRASIRNKIMKKNITQNNTVNKSNVSNSKISYRNQSVGRNRKNDISKNNDSSSNKISKNDSLTKFHEINYRKKLIQGIQIKNFSKVFNINNHSKIENKKK